MKPGEYVAEITENGKKREMRGSFNLAFIEIGLDQLKGYRGTTPHPEELEWEIRLYEWILSQPNPEEKADQYGKARHPGSGAPRSKRLCVKELGWEIT